jgi:UDPglucose 6-dehydrogenase
VAATDVTFIVVPTPSDETGGFSLAYLLDACGPVADALAAKDDYHLVVITSTVLPGATDSEIVPLLEQRSGKRVGADFGLCYNPEFIALGSVIRDMLRPDMVLIGESDERAGSLLAAIYETTTENEPVIARMNFVNAELAKISINTFVTTKISYANMLAELCERLPGADIDTVTSAVGADSRIGVKYLRGAMPYGGPCFPRDNVAFAALARSLGTRATLAEATDEVNRRQVARIRDLVASRVDAGARVAVLGLAYKAQTPVVEEAAGLHLAQLLVDGGFDVSVYDPVAAATARPLLGDTVTFAASAADAVTSADAVVIATPWDEFRLLDLSLLQREGGRMLVVDGWRVLDAAAVDAIAEYVALGTGRAALAADPR